MRWGPDGTNRYVPYQPDRPNRALRLPVLPVREQYGCPNAHYRPYPEFSRRAENEPVHPQVVAENGPDSSHFHYVHGATVTPVCLNWEAATRSGGS